MSQIRQSSGSDRVLAELPTLTARGNTTKPKAWASGFYGMSKLAKSLHERSFSAHRGAFESPTDPSLIVVFGNDGVGTDQRTWNEIAYLRHMLQREGLQEVAFGTSQNYTWAMLVKGTNEDHLNELVWACWFAACGIITEATAE